jgi:hypothetical protein
LSAQLVVAKELSEEKATRSGANQSLAREKAAHQTVEQSPQNSNEAKADLEWNLESAQASLTSTTNRLAFKYSTLDQEVIWEQKMEIQLKVAEEKLKAVEE